MLLRERHEFVGQFFVFPLQIDLVDNFPDPANRPQFFDKRMRFILRMLVELDSIIEFLVMAIDFPGKCHLGRARGLITTDDNKLIPGKQIKTIPRIGTIHNGPVGFIMIIHF